MKLREVHQKINSGRKNLKESLGFLLHLLEEYPLLPRKKKIEIVGTAAFLSIFLAWAAFSILPAFFIPRHSFRSPVAELKNLEVAVTHLRTEAVTVSPFQRLVGKVLGFKSLKAKPKRLQYEVFGYLPYWNFDKLEFLHLELLSTVAYFALEVDPGSGEFLKYGAHWENWNGSKMRELTERARRAKTDVVLTLKLFENEPIERFLNCGRCREITVQNTLREVKEKGVQGVNVDFEYLGTPPNETTIRFAQFMRDLADAVHQEVPQSKVSLAAYATSAREERIHNVELVGQFIDYVFVMGYDFFRPSSSHAGPVSPLTGVEKYGYDLQTSVKDFLAKIPAEKIVLGVPYYGYDWPVESREPNSKILEYNEQNGGLGLVLYEDTAADKGLNLNSQGWDADGEVPYYSYYDQDKKVWRQVYYENLRSLREKYDFIKSQKIRGVGIWALGFDGDRPELWELLEEKFTKL